MRCPRCFVILTRTDHAGVPLRQCPHCFGVWLGEVASARLTRLEDAAAAKDTAALADLAALVTEANTSDVVRCPECELPMAKQKFHMLIPVQIDRCPKCRGVWFDAGELRLVRTLYRELQQSTDPRIMALREKIALTRQQWDARRQALENIADVGEQSAEGYDLGWLLSFLS